MENKMTDRTKDIIHQVTELYGKRLYWHIRRIVVGHDDAEDVLQDTFLKICDKAESFRGDEKSLLAWCYRIATNEALHLLRRRARLFQSLDSVSAGLSVKLAEESAPDADRMSLLFQQAVLQLSTWQRIVFNLRYYDELTYTEISEITGKSENSLRTNYSYAVNKIKDYLKENSI
ncbi:MAG: RNA polymerase sigma factor [Candidatus Cryptobacteroides sp.]